MGLLDKIKKLENEKKDGSLPRYFLFRAFFISFLKDVGARKGAFLIKQGKFFHLAFPVSIDCKVFSKYSLDATIVSSVDGNLHAPFILLDAEQELLSSSLLYELDGLGCVFLVLDFENRLDVLQECKDALVSKIEDFKKEYKQNEILINTAIPPFPKYVGTSFIESKMQGAVLASTKPNFIEFHFDLVFKLSSLHEDVDNLSLFYSMVNRISKMIGRSNFAILEKDFKLKACIFSSLPLDDVVYGTTLKTVLSSIYGKELINKLELIFIKTLHDEYEQVSSWVSESYNPLEIL